MVRVERASKNADTSFKRCLKLVAELRLQELKAAVNDDEIWSQGRLDAGRRLAFRGVINTLNDKSHHGATLKRLERIAGMKKMLRSREHFIGSDEFDKGYLEVWLAVAELFTRGRLRSEMKKGVVKNPSEKKEHDVAS